MFYEKILRPILFRIDPERAHHLAAGIMVHPLFQPVLSLNRVCHRAFDTDLATDLCGIPLSNPIGLAAGFDKNASMFQCLHQLGFGFLEIGTVTGQPQTGNPKPRLFRLKADYGLINRMGFNNDDAADVARRLAAGKSRVPLGGNIGKSKVVPIEDAIEDYESSFRLLQPWVDYFVVNVSSPNTPNLRKLQEKEPLSNLLRHLMGLNQAGKPLLLKIAPDLSQHQLGDIVQVVEETGVSGVIATNTTISRSNLKTPASAVAAMGAGGLSGRPLTSVSSRMIRFLRRNLPKQVQIVGVGGIFDGRDAYEKIRSGAQVLQIYTGFIYGGQNTVFKIGAQLAQLLKRDGFRSVRDAVGVDVKG